MKLKLCLLMLCVTGLVAGCAEPQFCDIAEIHEFGSDATIEWLSANDEPLLRETVTHNEQVDTFCD